MKISKVLLLVLSGTALVLLPRRSSKAQAPSADKSPTKDTKTKEETQDATEKSKTDKSKTDKSTKDAKNSQKSQINQNDSQAKDVKA